MAHYYGGVQGARGEATRTGHKSSGMMAYAKTWKTQIEVRYQHDASDGKDYASIMVRDLSDGSWKDIWHGTEEQLATLVRLRGTAEVVHLQSPDDSGCKHCQGRSEVYVGDNAYHCAYCLASDKCYGESESDECARLGCGTDGGEEE